MGFNKRGTSLRALRRLWAHLGRLPETGKAPSILHQILDGDLKVQRHLLVSRRLKSEDTNADAAIDANEIATMAIDARP